MNERVKELAKQAGFFPELNYEHTGWHAAGHNDLFEKFAELIVRECAEVVGCNGHVSGFALGDLIKEHFGVEE